MLLDDQSRLDVLGMIHGRDAQARQPGRNRSNDSGSQAWSLIGFTATVMSARPAAVLRPVKETGAVTVAIVALLNSVTTRIR